MAIAASSTEEADRERVILVHGLGGWPALMQRLASHLEGEGFQTHCWGYSSISHPIEHSASLLSQFLSDQLRETDRDVHLVTHSMGGILARAIVNSVTPTGKLLMLAPPHRGSPVARHLGRFLGKVCRPLRELADTPHSFVNGLPTPPKELPVGIITASRDRVIPPGNTQLDCDAKRITVNTGHTSMLFSPTVAKLSANFLTQGLFDDRVTAVEASSEMSARVV